MNIMSTHQCSWPARIQDHPDKGSINKAPFSRGSEFLNVGYHAQKYGHSARKCRPIFASSVSNSMDPSDSDDTDKKKPQNGEMGGVNSEMLRESLEKIVGEDDSTFSGFDLATLIRNKYGRSYDVQLIKKIAFVDQAYTLKFSNIHAVVHRHANGDQIHSAHCHLFPL
uniref:Uncharacterized protein n=1 Tax=Glycine max TaxID=3847 RepID=C6TD01_SOYBN|nr:unknown [Glycine max]